MTIYPKGKHADLGRYSRDAALEQRRQTRRRKKTVLLASVVLAGLLLVGGTVAFLITSTSQVENSFTPAESKPAIQETMEGNVKSDVSVENTGACDSYIRVAIIANWAKTEEGKQVLAGVQPVEGDDYKLDLSLADNGWVKGADGYYYWTKPVFPGSSTGILVNQAVPTQNCEDYQLSIQIISESIQADGVDSDGKAPVLTTWESGVSEVNGDRSLAIKTVAGE